jgi:hypothetical protein
MPSWVSGLSEKTLALGSPVNRGRLFTGPRHKHLIKNSAFASCASLESTIQVSSDNPPRIAGERRNGRMPLYMDIHRNVEGLTPEAVADAHKKDLEVQDEYGVKYHRYWYNDETGEVFCLAEAPSKEAAEAVHREAHGLTADEIIEVREGS